MSLVKNLFYEFESGFRLDVPQLELSDGVTALWGESGSGKSTIFKCLIGLIQPPDLSWILNDIDLAKLPVSQRRLGVMLQKEALFEHLSGQENIEFAARARAMKKVEISEYVNQIENQLELIGILQRPVSQLSGGERQRVALARALCGQPRCLLLDEPFSALDAANRQRARLQLKMVASKFDLPVLLISHDEADLELADLTYTVKGGRIQ